MPTYVDNGRGDAGDFALIENHTVVLAEVATVEEEENPFFKDDDGNPQRNVVFKFKVLEGEHEGRFVWGRTPTTWSTNEKCKLRGWAEEILATTIPTKPLPPLNTDDLIGRRCRAVIGTYTKKNGDEGNKVTDVMRDKSAAPVDAYSEPF